MEMAAAATAPAAKKKRKEAHEEREPEEAITPPPDNPLPPTDTPHSGLPSEPEQERSRCQEPPRGARGEEGDGVDRIRLLPDAILGEIVSLLPTKDAARTRTLSSRWRDIWLSAPLNLDCSGGSLHGDEKVEAQLVTQILRAHKGPAHRFSVPVRHLHRCSPMVNVWLLLPALNNLQELEFDTGDKVYYYEQTPQVSLPVSALRFSATLRIATISQCHFPESAVDELCFPQLRQLGLEGVKISEGSLQSIISGSPVLKSLLLLHCYGFDSIRINSRSLASIGLYIPSRNLIIEDAPLLERLIQLDYRVATHVSVISAPKLETLGCLSNDYGSKYTFGTTILQKLSADSFTTEVRSVKILAIEICQLNLDTVINLIRFFPCLEKLYIQTSIMAGGKNLWRRKHRKLIKCLDICLKTVVLNNYRGIKSQVNFATFFILNAKMLELMIFEGFEGFSGGDRNHFIAEQHRLLQFEKRASGCAQLYFRSRRCSQYLPHIKHVGDLSTADPFECGSMCVR